MEINFEEKHLKNDSTAYELAEYIGENEQSLGLEEGELFYDFPVLKDADDSTIIAKLLFISRKHGLIVIATSTASDSRSAISELKQLDSDLENTFSLLYSRLIRNKSLRQTKTSLGFGSNSIIFAPNLTVYDNFSLEARIIKNTTEFAGFLKEIETSPLPTIIYEEVISTIEGAKGLVRPKSRILKTDTVNSKGALANKIETEIAIFDKKQKNGAIIVFDGLQRIRGLAGSGKTIVLAMKAAITHLRDPNATIIYTFYTKSLYQHIIGLITRFYRQFDDKDPDWSRLKVIHGWGGYSGEGVYFNACIAHNEQPVKYEYAKRAKDPFDFACSSLLKATEIQPIYDYIFVDEGQDFPVSFIKLCILLAKKNRVVFAYDELQTIFQTSAPAITEVVGVDGTGQPLIDLTEDIVLHKCYRNPREILVCAHAVGFGLYGRVVQMLENAEQWTDVGYVVHKGDFKEGSETIIERPENNSLLTISQNQSANEIVKAFSSEDFTSEINTVAQMIKSDIDEGLRPDDILVITVDDRNAKSYLSKIGFALDCLNVSSNNIHEDSYSIKQFQKDGKVTLSTVHKAKGNEAFMVYVVGVDALYKTYAGVRERNLLFTAMTRAKGWVRVSGIGEGATECKREIDVSLTNFPYLKFIYPGPEQLKVIRRDLAKKAIKKLKAERKLEEILQEMSAEEIKRFIEQRSIKKGG